MNQLTEYGVEEVLRRELEEADMVSEGAPHVCTICGIHNLADVLEE